MPYKTIGQPKVLLVSRQYFPDLGGIETAVRQYAKWYKEMGFDVTVLCCASKQAFRKKEEILEGIAVIRSASVGALFSLPLSLSFFMDFLIMARRADIVHINLPFPLASMAACLLPKNPRQTFLVSYHADVYRQKRLKYLTYPFDRMLLGRSDTLITGSPALRKNSELLATMNREIIILPYAVSCKNPCPPENRNKGYYLFFGRLVSYKGTQVLEDAIRILMEQKSDIKFLIFGTGPEAYRFQRLSAKFPEHVLFIQRQVSQEEKYRFLSAAKALLFPSVFPSEAFGIVQLEAMAAGKAIINTELGTGISWVAPNGECAITIEPGNPEKLAETIKACQAGQYDLEKLGESGRERVERFFSEEVIEKKFKNLIQSRVSGLPPSG